jgi:hypothetical protein
MAETLAQSLGTVPQGVPGVRDRAALLFSNEDIGKRGSEARALQPTLLKERARAETELETLKGQQQREQSEAEVRALEEDIRKQRAENVRVRGLEQPYKEFKAPQYTAADYAKGAAMRALTAVMLGGVAKTSALTQLKAIKAMQDAEKEGRQNDFLNAQLEFDQAEKKRVDFNERLKRDVEEFRDLLQKDTKLALAKAKIINSQLSGGIAAKTADVRSFADYAKLLDEMAKTGDELKIKTQVEQIKATGKTPDVKLTEVVDPQDPTRVLRVDANVYQAGTSLGAPGVFGVSGREPISETKRAKAETGKEDVEGIISNFRDIYSQLQQRGAITDTTKPAVDNITAWISTTFPLQVAQRMVGGESQKLRDNIAQQRPLLVQAIRKATGMSAQEMNSNVELQTYLNVATNPELSVQANMDALDNLSRLYGIGQPKQAAPATPARNQAPEPSGGGEFDEAKRRRLAELRRKRDEGTLGK